MLSPTGSTVYEWHRQSIPFRFRSHLKSEPWNPSGPPCQLVKVLCVAAPMIPRSLRTSKNGRSLREAQGSLLAASLRSACDLRYPFPRHTNEEANPVDQREDCNG